jgi:excisionase family DNA binding protein
MATTPYLTVEDVAKELAVAPETVRRWIRNGELNALNLGGPAGYRIARAELDRFIRERMSRPSDNG